MDWNWSKIGNLGKCFDFREREKVYGETAEKCIRRDWLFEHFNKYYSSDHDQKDEMGGSCGMPVGEKCVADFGGADHLEYIDIEGMVTKRS